MPNVHPGAPYRLYEPDGMFLASGDSRASLETIARGEAPVVVEYEGAPW